MGRRQYLTRLALGRSPYQITTPEELRVPNAFENPPEHDIYVQQYDPRWRPINPATEATNTALRHAQNNVLSLMGIVIREEQHEAARGVLEKFLRDERNEMLEREQSRGQDIAQLCLPLLQGLVQLWPEAILRRVQIGMYRSSESFATILADECRTVGQSGLLLGAASLVPAVGHNLFFFAVNAPLSILIEQVVNRAARAIARTRLARERTPRWLSPVVTVVMHTMIHSIDLLLLPTQFYFAGQTLGLAPAHRLLPPLRSLLPWHPSSIHKWGWHSHAPNFLCATGGFIAAPAAILMLNNVLQRVKGPTDGLAFEVDLADPPNSWSLTNYRPRVTTSFSGWLSYFTSPIQPAFFRWTGWITVPESRSSNTDCALDSDQIHHDDGSVTFRRANALAVGPATTLKSYMDDLIAKLITLPLESLVLRTVAQSFPVSALPQSPRALGVAQRLYRPWGGGPLAGIRTGGWREAGAYASKLGLALALVTGVDAVLFAGMYFATRTVGVREFGWAGRGRRERRRSSG